MRQIEFCERVSQYRHQFYITAYAILGNEADAEDAVCNAILNGYEHLSQLKDSKKFKAWMLTITKNEALKLCGKRMEFLGDGNIERLLPPSYDSHNAVSLLCSFIMTTFPCVISPVCWGSLSEQ